jgi:hypothetical protein
MAAPRKKWATRLHPADPRKTHDSKPATYRYVQQQAGHYRDGMVRADLNRITVYVDEGLGRGWELYETINLADLAPKEN